ncbi:MAG: PepSY-associated TM helix domain-containing protein [Pseudomonadota bacterium]
MRRKLWFNWHSWAGFKFSILMSFVLITGTLATVSMEIDWLVNPALRAQHGQPDSINWGEIHASARAAYPNSELMFMSAPYAPWFNAEVTARDTQDKPFRIYVDPVTHTVTGDGPWNNWQRFFRQTHRHLMLPTQIGITIVGLLAIPLFISFFSSFFIYKRWWRGFFKWPQRETTRFRANPVRRSRSFWGDMHRILGIWSLWFIFLMAVTGSWYLVERWGGAAGFERIGGETLPPQVTVSGERLNQLAAVAKAQYPQLDIQHIRLNTQENAHIMFQGEAEAVLVRPRANQVAILAGSGEVVDIRRGHELSVHQRISEMADPLHFGTLAGTPTRIIWFLFGIMMSALSLSGMYLFGLRIARAEKLPVSQPPSVAWRLSWRDLGIAFRWTTTTLVFVTLALGAVLFTIEPLA